MEFLFFNDSDRPLFMRSDAETAEWSVEQYALHAEFPFDEEKKIQRGMRLCFQDEDGAWQAFEVLKVQTYEPAHYQAVTAEHIAVSELTGDHTPQRKWTNITAQTALTALLTGTLWTVGDVTASGTSSADCAYGSVWSAKQTIEKNWNVYIIPRVTIGSSGITGRYLDVMPAEGTYRGLLLSIDKNIEDACVTYDDSDLLTAMYGYGRTSPQEQDIEPTDPEPEELPPVTVTFENVVWAETADHPAKPAGQAYIVSPVASLYQRNGRNRFGYYQNGDITNPEVLLQKTWEYLKTCMEPAVTIEGTLSDLKRLGYADVPLRLHDTAYIDIRPTGEKLQREVIALTIDLIDPTNTTVIIGTYIPNIVYINRETAKKASGGGGGGGGQSNLEKQFKEFQTMIYQDDYQILLRAWQQNINNEILRQAGLSLDANGVIVYANDNVNNWQSKLNVQANRIGLVVSGTGANASIKAAEIVAAINQSGSSVTISADHILLDGQAVATSLVGYNVNVAQLEASNLDVLGSMTVDQSITCDQVITNAVTIDGADAANAIVSFGSASSSGGSITIPTTTLGGSAGPSINFNIAATQFFIDSVAAARPHSLSTITLGSNDTGTSTQLVTVFCLDDEEYDLNTTVNASAVYNAGRNSVDFYSESGWSSGSKTLTLDNGKTSTVTIPATGSWSSSKPSGSRYSYNCTVGGRTLYSYADFSSWNISGNAGGTTVSFSLGGHSYSHAFSSYP